jgi:selenium metabolism protein YedF
MKYLNMVRHTFNGARSLFMKTVDARGQLCPKPLIMTKKAINQAQVDEKFTVLIDNETSKNNVERFLKENEVFFSTTQNGNVFELVVSKSNQELINENAEEFCPVSNTAQAGGDVIVINKDSIGHGPDELAAKLVKGFFTTIMEVPTKPLGIAFYNSGINLCLCDSPVLEEIQAIEKAGCKILVCGTCIDHYEVKDQVKVGIVSNMYDILGLMQKASKVFTP